MISKVITLARRPSGMPVPEDFLFGVETVPSLGEGEALLKTLYVSVDPYLRGKMNGTKQPRFELGEAVSSKIVAEVIDSRHPGFAIGDQVSHYLPWKEYIVSSGAGLVKLPADGTPLTAWLGVLGVTGLSAYFALLDIGAPKPGETLVVSGAAGAVGSIAGQLGKFMGCRVVGIVGSDEKARLITQRFGFDEAVNYRSSRDFSAGRGDPSAVRGASDLSAAVAAACPNGVDIYFDNVGGPVSDAVLPHMNPYGRIPVCGTIADYNATGPSQALALLPLVVYKFLRVQGFLIGDLAPRFPKGVARLREWLATGKLVYAETILDGFDRLPEAFIGLFEGRNEGKMIVKV